MLPLEGLTVADFSNWFPGPYCTRLLRDLGARVIKVERTVSGDPERKASGTFGVVNAGKESIAVDLSTVQGQEIAHRLISQSDILLEGFRPGTTKRLGIDYETVSKLKEDIIYCSISGFGQTGPLSRQPAHNINALAEAGVLSMGQRGKAVPEDNNGVWAADLSAAMFAVVTIMGALLQRTQRGKGAYIDISMADCCISWLSGPLGELFSGQKTKEEIMGYPAYGVFKAKEGNYLAIAAIDDRHWQALCKALELEEYKDNPSVANLFGRRRKIAEINRAIADRVITRERDYWLGLLKEVGIAANSVNTPEEISSHEHFLQRGLLNIPKDRSPAMRVAFPAIVNNERWDNEPSNVPQLGQDTEKVLKSLGYSDEEIENLAVNGVIEVVTDNCGRGSRKC